MAGKEIVLTNSVQQTEALAQTLAQKLQPGDVIAFRGGLGAGKTAFVRGLAKGLGVTDEVSSPTFAIVNIYRGGRLTLAHFDMYRIESADALEDTGYYDLIADGAPVVYAIEWSENIEEALPEDAILVTITRTGEETREICIEGGRALC